MIVNPIHDSKSMNSDDILSDSFSEFIIDTGWFPQQTNQCPY